MILLGGEGASTTIVFHALDAAFPLRAVIVERRPQPRAFLGARVRRLGVRRVAGQLLFRALVVPVLERASRARRTAILHDAGLDDSPIPTGRVTGVNSVNDSDTERILRDLAPAVVVVNGTRIIHRRLLDALPGTVFLNLHAGITPLYRGVHGAYWALVRNDPDHCGVTVHRIDAGIDTGAIVAQARITPTHADDYTTYPFLQLAAGLPLLVRSVTLALEGRLTELAPPAGPSCLWTHPTAFDYLRNRLRGVH